MTTIYFLLSRILCGANMCIILEHLLFDKNWRFPLLGPIPELEKRILHTIFVYSTLPIREFTNFSFTFFFLLPFNFNRQKIYSFHMFFEIKISNKYIYGKNALPATRSSVGSSAIARLKQQNMFFSSSFRLYVKVATITERWWTYEKKKKLQYQSCSINRCFAPQIVWWTIMRALLIMSNKFKWSFDRLCVFGYGCPYSCAHNDDHLISRVYDKLFFVCNQNDVITFLLLFIDRRVTTAFGW